MYISYSHWMCYSFNHTCVAGSWTIQPICVNVVQIPCFPAYTQGINKAIIRSRKFTVRIVWMIKWANIWIVSKSQFTTNLCWKYISFKSCNYWNTFKSVVNYKICKNWSRKIFHCIPEYSLCIYWNTYVTE